MGCALPFEQLCKDAAMAMCEVLVLEIYCTRGSMSDIGFESALEHAFGKLF